MTSNNEYPSNTLPFNVSLDSMDGTTESQQQMYRENGLNPCNGGEGTVPFVIGFENPMLRFYMIEGCVDILRIGRLRFHEPPELLLQIAKSLEQELWSQKTSEKEYMEALTMGNRM